MCRSRGQCTRRPSLSRHCAVAKGQRVRHGAGEWTNASGTFVSEGDKQSRPLKSRPCCSLCYPRHGKQFIPRCRIDSVYGLQRGWKAKLAQAMSTRGNVSIPCKSLARLAHLFGSRLVLDDGKAASTKQFGRGEDAISRWALPTTSAEARCRRELQVVQVACNTEQMCGVCRCGHSDDSVTAELTSTNAIMRVLNAIIIISAAAAAAKSAETVAPCVSVPFARSDDPFLRSADSFILLCYCPGQTYR